MDFPKLLGLRPGVTPVIGSGGKNTHQRRLPEELTVTVLLCTTTHIRPFEEYPLLTAPTPEDIRKALTAYRVLCLGTPCENGKLTAPSLSIETLADYVLVEADGSKRLPAKAHAAWEPVLPPERNRTVCVFGASALGQPIQDAAHRPELYAPLAETSPDAVITPAIAARVLAKEGGFDVLFINQADVLEDPAAALQPFADALTCPAIYGALAEGSWTRL